MTAEQVAAVPHQYEGVDKMTIRSTMNALSPFIPNGTLDTIRQACMLEPSMITIACAQSENMLLAMHAMLKKHGPDTFGRWLRGDFNLAELEG